MYKEIKGDLIKLALEGKFDVIGHGCNCFCVQKSGLAPQMVKVFGTDAFKLEQSQYKGDINKLGSIEYRCYDTECKTILLESLGNLHIVNMYTQFYAGQNSPNCNQPLDYEALTLCLRKMNYIFSGEHIGLPQIGCGLAGGDWNIVKSIIQKELNDCDVTIVIYEK